MRHFEEFPNGTHDDFVDATAVMFHASASGHARVGRMSDPAHAAVRGRGAFL